MKKLILSVITILLLPVAIWAQDKTTFTVATDGSGDFTAKQIHALLPPAPRKVNLLASFFRVAKSQPMMELIKFFWVVHGEALQR